jgi:predicted O-methyltransferase YrrM
VTRDALAVVPMGLSRLATSDSQRARFLFSSLPVIRSGWLASSELTALSKVEELRRELLSSATDLFTVDYGAAEPQQSLSAEEMAHGRTLHETVGNICRVRSEGVQECTFLFRMVRLLRPVHCLELGTCLGLTAAYIGSALELNGSGSLISVEGCPRLAEIAMANLQWLGLRKVCVREGRFQDLLPCLLAAAPFDFVYIDGHHDRDATLDYFDQIASRGTGDTAIVIDDIGWSDGMKAAWAYITKSPRTKAWGTFNSFGLCFSSSHT